MRRSRARPGDHDDGHARLPPLPRSPTRSPSGRTPRWVVEEALRPRRVRRRRARVGPGARRRAWRSSPTVAVVLVALLWFAPTLLDHVVLPTLRPHLPNASAPPPGVEAAAEPLGTPPPVAPSDRYRLHDSPDPEQEMVAYDPCRPVHYVVRPDNAPAGGQLLVEQAVAEVSAATGLQFVLDGPTDEAPAPDRDTYHPDRYGKRWAPVLVTWSGPEEAPELAGDVAGLGGSSYARVPDGPFVHVAGQVTLDAPDLLAMLERPGGPDQVRAVIMHELGHVVGLAHVDDPGQLMHVQNTGVTGFAEGDRAGLARLGAGPCVPRL